MKGFLLGLLASLSVQAAPIELQSVDGRIIVAELLFHTESIVAVNVKGARHDIPMSRLTVPTLLRVIENTGRDGQPLKTDAPETATPPSMTTEPATATPETEAVRVNPDIRLTAKNVSYGRSTSVTWSSTWGSFVSTTTSQRAIEVTVSTMSKQPQEAIIEVVFLMRGPMGGSVTSVSLGKMPARTVFAKPFIAGAPDQAPGTSNALGIKASDVRYVGWVVRAIDAENKIVAVTANLKTNEKYAYSLPLQ